MPRLMFIFLIKKYQKISFPQLEMSVGNELFWWKYLLGYRNNKTIRNSKKSHISWVPGASKVKSHFSTKLKIKRYIFYRKLGQKMTSYAYNLGLYSTVFLIDFFVNKSQK